MVKEYAEALIIALVLALFIRTFVVQAFKIPSESMLQTLQVGDHLLVNKFIYGIKIPFTGRTLIPVSSPHFQDIIVFEYPEDPSKDFIKRVIGVPGDTVELRGGVLFRNGEEVKEPYLARLPPKAFTMHLAEYGPVAVPEGKYFVMGDNRNNSHDSRYWGFVDQSAILGKAWMIYWSWDFDPSFTIRWGRLGHIVR
jgi:signal peptidase I